MYNSDDFGVGYALGQNAGNGYNNGMFGGDWIWAFLIFALLGWGGNGFGGFGGNNGALTRGELCQDMNFNDLQSAVRGISQGICDSTYALNNAIQSGFATTQQSLCQGFNGTQREIANLGFDLQQCCCQTQRAIDGVNYNMATNTANIVQASNANTQRILDFLCQEKISALQAENSALTAQLSQNAQTNAIVNQLRPCPIPAYITCNPYESAYGFGRNGSCGCGC